MSKRDFLIFMFKWKGTIFGSFFFVVGLVTAFVYLFPQQYLAVARVIVEGSRAPVDRSLFTPGGQLHEVMSTETGIVKSRTVLEAVVDDLKPHERPSSQNKVKLFLLGIKKKMQDMGLLNKISRREGWIKQLDEFVEAKSTMGSGVMVVSYKDENPEWATSIVNTVIENYIDHHLNLYSSDGSSAFYLQQMNKALAEYKLESGSDDLDRRIIQMRQDISKMNSNLSKMKADLKHLSGRAEKNSRSFAQLQRKIRKQENDIISRKVILRDLEVEQAETNRLQKEFFVEREPYKSFKARYEAALVKEATNHQMVNVRVLDRAGVPESPKRPRLFFIMISIPAGLVVAFSLGFIREYFDRRVSDPAVVERIFGIPELGSIAKTRSPSSFVK